MGGDEAGKENPAVTQGSAQMSIERQTMTKADDNDKPAEAKTLQY